jgi:NAD(P)-dependent dehydrogenase (short-subunit alcohol dehydrogenase family)
MSGTEPQRPPVAVVTGAGSGIGRVVTQRLVGVGYCVVLAGRRRDALDLTLSGLPDGRGSFVVPTDVTRPDSVDALFDATADRAGRLDLLFNNAGSFGNAAPIEDYQLESWTRTVETNLTGAFLCAQRAFRQMLRQTPSGGRIINNGSISAHVPRPHAVAYTATKHGVTGLTKALALEGRRHGIACGQIDVGNAATEMTGQFSVGTLQADGSVAAEPTMSAEHVADAVLYMARLPLEANVLSLTVMATGMPFVGRG